MVVTAEEFLDNHRLGGVFVTEELRNAAMVIAKEFAEAHRQECLKQVAKKARVQHIPYMGGYDVVNKDSVINAYSKKHIK